MQRLRRYLWKINTRPRLSLDYHQYGDYREPDHDEREIIALRIARTSHGARALLDHYGSLDAVLRHVPPPKRKKPPVVRRLVRFARYWFPGG